MSSRQEQDDHTGREPARQPVAHAPRQTDPGAVTANRRRLLAGAIAAGFTASALSANDGVRDWVARQAGAGRGAVGPRTVAVANNTRLPGRNVPSAGAGSAGTAGAGRAAVDAAGHPTPLQPYRDPLPIPRVLRPRRGEPDELTVRMTVARVRMHSQLPTTTIWGFDGTLPGPTIEVRRDRPLSVRWVNQLSGKMPLVAVAPLIEWADPPLWDRPGRDGAPVLTDVSNLPPWTVIHLHGAETGMDNDGWPEAGIAPGAVQVAEYANAQRATALWYHDHAMPVSRWNTIAGLSGAYLIRDDTEAGLGLPAGRHEVPLLLCDRNFDLDEAGRLTGVQLYKTVLYATEPELQATSFSGPFTTVNGIIWPYLAVEPRWYRFRVLNLSNVRPYHLQLTFEDGSPVPADAIQLIGGDGGLLPAPVSVDGVLSVVAAERADVLVNFAPFRGRTLNMVNVDYDPGPWPQVMQFRVGRHGGDRFHPPAVLDREFPPVDDDAMADAPERMVMFPPLGTGQIEQWEMEQIPAPTEPLPIDGVVQVKGADQTVRTYRRVARHFNDPVRFMVNTGDWERWTWINLDVGGWPHPQHVHSTHFRVLHRHFYDVADKFEFFFDEQGRTVGGGTVVPIEYVEAREISPMDSGWKDVVHVNNGEAVSVAAHFAHSGRFLHHCHMRDHEDMGMMRPFVVMPAEVMKIEHQGGHPMGGGAAHGGH
ncbi:multicopper oxidase family protein [Solwaraspora sp. WMMB335]|uniref:multicopper oxidase family protein n=1 Tax=Solwaraspora sp. WMMB335 TaxID=3404118 RepID=UPI003B93ED18